MRKRGEQGSTTREVIQQELQASKKRLEAIPREQDRLVEGYRKGLVPDDLMRTQMAALKTEREQLQARVVELESQLLRLEVSIEQESQALAFAERMRNGLANLNFAERQQTLRLLVEDVTCSDGRAIIHTIIPLSPPEEKVQLLTPPREGVRG